MNNALTLSTQFWAVFCIILGLCFALFAWLIVRGRKSLARVLIGLAKIGPCTGRQLAMAGYAQRGTVYIDLGLAIEQGLVRDRVIPLSHAQLVARDGIPEREFRLTTKGWSMVSSLGPQVE